MSQRLLSLMSMCLLAAMMLTGTAILTGCESVESAADNASGAIARTVDNVTDDDSSDRRPTSSNSHDKKGVAGQNAELRESLAEIDPEEDSFLAIHYEDINERGLPVTEEEFLAKYEELKQEKRDAGEYPDKYELGQATRHYFYRKHGVETSSMRRERRMQESRERREESR